MYEYVGKMAPFLILAFLALFDGGTPETALRSFFSFNVEGSQFLCPLTALQLLVLQPTKLEPEVSVGLMDPSVVPDGSTWLYSADLYSCTTKAVVI